MIRLSNYLLMAPAASTKSISTLLFSLSRHMRMRVAPLSGKHESLVQWTALEYISLFKNPQASDLATSLLITRPSATTLINSLLRSGYITRQPDIKDKRAIRLRLTSKGKAFLRTRQMVIEQKIVSMLKVLNQSEREQFKSLIEKIINFNETRV